MALPKVNQGDLITSKSWNDMIDEIDKKVIKAGDTMSGPLVISGGNWDVANTEGDFKIGDAANRLKIGVATAGGGAGHVRIFQNGTNKLLSIGTGTNSEINLVNGNVGIGTPSPAVALDVNGTTAVNALRLNGSGNGMSMSRTNTDLNLSLGFAGFVVSLPGQPPPAALAYRFRVGHDSAFFLPGQGSYVQRFSVNQSGDIVASGSKAGYVADFFLNKVGDPLEEGDVVIIGPQDASRYYGTYNNIPVPEVDLTDKAYDTRVCGIVAKVVAELDLPPVDPIPVTEAEIAKAKAADKGGKKSKSVDAPVELNQMHPFAGMGAPESKDFNHRVVQPDQMGHMVTLGAFAHCKVDADIAAIAPGDLLTTSPTKGHAQKVTDIKKATGAIIGKALAGLKKGKGKIPIMVLLQ